METPDRLENNRECKHQAVEISSSGNTRRTWKHQAVGTLSSGNTRQWKHQAGVETSEGVWISGGVEVLVKRANNRRLRIELWLRL